MLAPGELDEGYLEIVENLPLMESVFMVQLGLDIDPAPYLDSGVNYYYRTYDISGSVGRLKEGSYHEGADGFLICNPSLYSPQSAPSGHYAVTVYTVAPDTPTGFTWADAREAMADRLLDFAGERIPDLKDHIVKREILTPADFRRITGLAHHSFGGCAPVMGKPTTPHRTGIEGLWFAGAQSESGAGINNVMEGAWRVAHMIRTEA
jgi:phytoene dehydrogenase-like protein